MTAGLRGGATDSGILHQGTEVVTLSASGVTIPGTLTVTGKPAFSAGLGAGNTNQSCVRVHTANGYGSTNTKIRRFTTIALNQGTDITYADSATLGASFTVAVAGVYAFSYTEAGSAGMNAGLSLNTSAPTTSIFSIPAAEILLWGGGVNLPISWIGYLAAGSIVRPHTDGVSAGAPPAMFTAARVS